MNNKSTFEIEVKTNGMEEATEKIEEMADALDALPMKRSPGRKERRRLEHMRRVENGTE